MLAPDDQPRSQTLLFPPFSCPSPASIRSGSVSLLSAASLFFSRAACSILEHAGRHSDGPCQSALSARHTPCRGRAGAVPHPSARRACSPRCCHAGLQVNGTQQRGRQGEGVDARGRLRAGARAQTWWICRPGALSHHPVPCASAASCSSSGPAPASRILSLLCSPTTSQPDRRGRTTMAVATRTPPRPFRRAGKVELGG